MTVLQAAAFLGACIAAGLLLGGVVVVLREATKP